MWWNLNKWEYLHINEILRRNANVSRNADQDLGGVKDDGSVPGGALSRDIVEREVLPVLKHALKDRYYLNRQAAIIALGKTGDPSAVAPLLETLKDRNQVVRESAALALGLLGQSQSVDYLTALMRDSDAGRRLIGGKGKVSPRTRMHATFALGLLQEPRSLTALLELVETQADKNKELATFGVAAIGAVGARSAVPDLCRMVTNAQLDHRIRNAACVALSKIGDRGPIVLRVLENALDAKKSSVVQAAATALGTLARPEDVTIVNSLAQVADKHGDMVTRALALMGLARIGSVAAYDTTTDFLTKRGLLGGYAPLAVAVAAKKAGRATHAKAILNRQLKRIKDPDVRRAYYIAFGLLGSKKRVDDLVAVAGSRRSPDERASAVAALGMIGEPQCADLLRSLTAPDVHGAIRGEAALSLGLVGKRSEASERLIEVLGDAENNFIRAGCALALGILGHADSVKELRDMATGADVNGDTRAFASGALGLLAEPDDLPVLYRYRANNVFHFDLPVMRSILLLL